MKKFYFRFALILPIVLLLGCEPDSPEYIERTPEKIFAQATEYLEDTNYRPAAMEFIEIERQHPYSDLAARGGYMAGYAYYKAKEYGDAIQSLNHFLKLHPAHENVDYALYLKSMCYFDQVSDVRREQYVTTEALRTMLLLQDRFPENPYTKNVEAKIKMLKNFLAGKEMFIARKLLKNDNLLAALKRFQVVVKSYEKTPMRIEALYRIVEIYQALHLSKQAQDIQKLLETNHPESEWTQRGKEILLND
ncbi:MAG: outer membrane protein assembly factor BamD [Alphaproteobacteria bacterium]